MRVIRKACGRVMWLEGVDGSSSMACKWHSCDNMMLGKMFDLLSLYKHLLLLWCALFDVEAGKWSFQCNFMYNQHFILLYSHLYFLQIYFNADGYISKMVLSGNGSIVNLRPPLNLFKRALIFVHRTMEIKH